MKLFYAVNCSLAGFLTNEGGHASYNGVSFRDGFTIEVFSMPVVETATSGYATLTVTSFV